MKPFLISFLLIILSQQASCQWVYRSGSLFSKLSDGDNKITKAEFRTMIMEYSDSEARNSLNNHQITLAVGTILYIPGIILCIKSLDRSLEASWGWFISKDEREELERQSRVFGISGLIVTSASITMLFLSKNSLDNAIDRFNMLKYNSRFKLGFSTNELSLRYQF